MKKITSLDNPEIKNIVKLQDSKYRKQQNTFIIEGLRAINTAVNSNLKLIQIYITENNQEAAKALVSENQITLVTQEIIKKISASVTPNGFLALFEIPKNSNKINNNKIDSGIVLVNITDPGNMGTLIRTAAACDLKTVVIIDGTDPWGPKVVQASAGTIGLVNIFQITWQELIANKDKLNLYALVVKDGDPITNIKTKNNLLIIGNESTGIPESLFKDCDKLITLPMPGNTESLNAAIAGSIAIYLTAVLN